MSFFSVSLHPNIPKRDQIVFLADGFLQILKDAGGLGFGWLERGFLVYCDERVFWDCDAQQEALLMI
nr:hypothetical protein [Tanacetum cinerariifolium]